jgi:hypothetical protein
MIMIDTRKILMLNSCLNQRGSLSLEAALVVPVILLLTGSLIIGLICVESEIKVKGALDRTAAELSLISPVCQLFGKIAFQAAEVKTGDDETTWTDELNMIVSEILPGQSIGSIVDDALLDLSSTALIGQLMQKRLDYWLAEAWSGQPGWAGQVGSRRLYLDWKIDRQQLWLCLSYELKSPAGIILRQANVVVPLWVGQGNQEQNKLYDQVWQLDNFSRGQLFRQLYGANLPDDFPVIARFANGEAVSIKSMDLTAPTYRQPEAVFEQLQENIAEVAEFAGTKYIRDDRTILISSESIRQRRLLLIIPGNCGQVWLADLLNELVVIARARSVGLQIVRHGVSLRYSQVQSAETP